MKKKKFRSIELLFLGWLFAFGCGSGGGGSTNENKENTDADSDTNSPPGNLEPAATASRLTGVAPLAVFFDATVTGGLSPSESLPDGDYLSAHFSWDFGDDSGSTWRTNGGSSNETIGFLAAHAYEVPGTYNVTLTVMDTEGHVATAVVAEITVTDPDTIYGGTATRCISTSGGFGGCPVGAEQQVSSDLVPHIAWLNGEPGHRLLLSRGESWSTDIVDLDGQGPATLGAFGAGTATARIAITGTSESGFAVTGTDWRVMDVEIDGSGAGGGSNADAAGTEVLALRVRSHNWGSVGWGMGGTYVYVVDSSIDTNGYFSIYSDGIGVAIMGSYIDQIRAATSFLKPLESRDVFIADNTINASRAAPSTGIKWHSRRGVIVRNEILAGTSRIGMSNSDGPPTGLDVDKDLGIVLIEGNLLNKSGNASNDEVSSFGFSLGWNDHIVIRNNVSKDILPFLGFVEGPVRLADIYNNTVLATDDVESLNLDMGDLVYASPDYGDPPGIFDVRIFNNIIANIATGGIYPSYGYSAYFEDEAVLNAFEIFSNLYYRPSTPLSFHIGGNDMDWNGWQANGRDPGSLVGDPNFVSTNTDEEDFVLPSAASPATDNADPAGAIVDYLGTRRPKDGDESGTTEPDIGAMER